jgi:3-oxoacyl-(acyl-carrier-protein) synthase
MKQKKRETWITGLGIVSPLGIGKDEFWKALIQGRSAIQTYIPEGLEKAGCSTAAIVSLKPHSKEISRSTQLALKACQYALSDAGLSPSSPSMSGRIGLYLAETLTTIDTWEKILYNQTDNQGRRSPDTSNIFKTSTDIIAGLLGLNGECVTIGSGCTGGLSAISKAAQDISLNICPVIVCGGTDSNLSRFSYGVLSQARLLTPCDDPAKAGRPFDVDRDGEVTAEGSTFMVVEDPEHATKRGIQPIVKVTGFCEAGEGYHFKYNKPDGLALAKACERALEESGLNPSQIGLVIAHASGFKGSDTIEVKALASVFSTCDRLPPVISIKGSTGQPFSAGGPTQVAAAALAIQNCIIPPTVHCEKKESDDPFDHVQNARQEKLSAVLITSYGYGGGKAALVIRAIEPPEERRYTDDNNKKGNPE